MAVLSGCEGLQLAAGGMALAARGCGGRGGRDWLGDDLVGLPWKKIGSGLKAALTIGALANPAAASVLGIVEAVERATAGMKGGDKKALVEAISDELLATDLDGLTPEQEQAIKAARSECIDAYVAVRNAEAKAEQAKAALEAAIAAIKAH